MSLTTAVRSLNRNALKNFPGASQTDIAVYLKYVFEAAATNLKSTFKDEDAVAAADKELNEAAERGEAWAVNLRDSVLVNVVKPIVDNANDKGVDPVAALRLADFSDEQAREYVTALEQRGDDAPAVSTEDDSAEDDSAESEGDGDDADSPVSYGYGTPVTSA